MKRPEITKVAKLLGLPANGKNDELLAKINEKLKEINEALKPAPQQQPTPRNPQSGARLARGRKLEDGRKGLHPITGKVIY